MRKLLLPILFILILLSISACNLEDSPSTTTGNQWKEPTQETTTLHTQLTTAPAVIYDASMTAVSMPLFTEESFAKDGALLFSYTRQDMSLVLSDPIVADNIHVDFLNRVDFENSAARSTLQSAQVSYTGQSDWTPYFYSCVYNPVRIDQSILSFYGTETSYNGSPRPSTVSISVTYDLATGSALSLKEVLLADYSAENLCSLIVDALRPYAENELLFGDYNEIITDMFFTNTPVDSWYFSQNGLCFYFNPYEIAPYSTGTVLAEIPYELLGSLLKDIYFPAEQVDFIGSLAVKNFEESDTSVYSQFAEVVLDQSGTKVLLSTDGTLLDLRLEIGSWSNSSNAFTPAATVFAAEAITAGDALIVQATADTLMNLRLTYKTDGATVSQKLIP